MKKPALARGLAWSITALSLTLALAGLAVNLLAQVQSHDLGQLDVHELFSPATALTYALIGALVAARQPRIPIGWIFGAVGVLAGLTSLSFGYRMLDQSREAPLPGIEIARWLDLWVWVPVTILPLTFVLLLFPDGRLPSPAGGPSPGLPDWGWRCTPSA